MLVITCLLTKQNVMKKLMCLFCLTCIVVKAQTPSLTVTSVSGSYSITCATPFLDFAAFCTSGSGAINIAWQSVTYTSSGSSATINTPGTYTVTANSGTASATQVFTVYMNVTAPVSSISSTFQTLTSTMTPVPVTVTAISPTLNFHHEFYAPTGGTTVANAVVSVYQPGSTGTYTHCIIDEVNGCSSCQPFTIQYGSPGTVSVPESVGIKNSFSIYPNPVKDHLIVKNTGDQTNSAFSIYNGLGQLIDENILPNSEYIISTENLSNGLYIIKRNGEGPDITYRRFIVQK